MNDNKKNLIGRASIYGIKVASSMIFSDLGIYDHVSLIYVNNNILKLDVVADFHNFIKIRAFFFGKGKLSKPQIEHIKKFHPEIDSKKIRGFIKEIFLPKDVDCISLSTFVNAKKVKISGISKGKGFSGVMKRHNFKGLRASHGVSKTHRSQGSTGQCQDPGRVNRGKKMAGQLGAEFITINNVGVLHTDIDKSLIVVKGSIPGFKDSVVRIELMS
ncbi:50S ribosomal protein L3 [Anaplasmataceae bacterium AB001_6]|nr:50S ribosomal protein L3 [Anaplasmataceae bacterium AB001_6]